MFCEIAIYEVVYRAQKSKHKVTGSRCGNFSGYKGVYDNITIFTIKETVIMHGINFITIFWIEL